MGRRKLRTQYAALPFVVRDGKPLVMLITSRETRRWIIPKGWPEKATKPHTVAAREAYEEAGLKGRIQSRPLAAFYYEKRLKSGRVVTCVVETFLFEVEQELDEWPEKAQRERRWMAPAEAADMVRDKGLAAILLSLPVQVISRES